MTESKLFHLGFVWQKKLNKKWKLLNDSFQIEKVTPCGLINLETMNREFFCGKFEICLISMVKKILKTQEET